MSIKKGIHEIRKIHKGEKTISKIFAGNKRVFPNVIDKFIENASSLGGNDQFIRDQYNSIDEQIRSDADVLIFPSVADTGVIYAMDNMTGDPLPVSFSRASQATFYDKALNMQLAGNDIPRIDYGNYSKKAKIMLEKESINYVIDSDFNLKLNIIGAKYSLIDFDWKNTVLAEKAAMLSSGQGSTSFYYKRSDRPLVRQTYSMFYVNDEFTDVILGANSSSDGVISANGISNSNTSSSLIRDGVYKLIVTGDTTIASWFGFAKQSITLPRNSYVVGYQIENGDECTSYIPTTDSLVTRSKELLSYTLLNDCSVYLKTTKNEVVLDKPAGLWAIHDDLDNEGIICMAIFDRVLTEDEKQQLII